MILLLSDKDFNNFFADLLEDMSCEDVTRSYLTNLYTTFKTAHNDLSNQNITLSFLEARSKSSFISLQNIGDWIFFTQTVMPEYLQPVDYYQDIARLSYYTCYKLLHRQWAVYNELADNLIQLEDEAIQILQSIKSTV